MCIEIHVGQENGNEYEYFIQMTTSTIQANAIRQGMRHLEINANQSFRITIEDDIEIIEAGAFKVTQDNQTFRNLISVNICGNTMRVIGKKAFFGCRNIISIRISDNVTEIGEGAFSGCKKLKCLGQNPETNNPVIEIPNGITSISANLFKDCFGWTGRGANRHPTGVTAVMLPNGLTAIERGAFSGCEQLSLLAPQNEFSVSARAGRSVAIIPENVTTIGSKAFENCKKIERVELPNELSEIRRMTFSGCIQLQESNVPNNINAIWDGAFSGCNRIVLHNRNLLNKVNVIGKKAFDDNIRIQERYIPDLLSIDGVRGSNHSIADIFGVEPNREQEVVNIFLLGLRGTLGYSTAGGWMQTPYVWPTKKGKPQSNAKDEKDTILEFDCYSRWLNYSLNRLRTNRQIEDISSCKDCIISILEWGKVDQNLDYRVPEFFDGLQMIEDQWIRNILVDKNVLANVLRMGVNVEKQNRNNESLNNADYRISSWSKVLAAYKPGIFFIYDSRVAFALDRISTSLGVISTWHIPQDRGEDLNNARQEANEDNLPTCYYRYLCLLDQLAWKEDIIDKYDNLPPNQGINAAYDNVFAFVRDDRMRKHKAIMAHLEKMLFMQKDYILN